MYLLIVSTFLIPFATVKGEWPVGLALLGTCIHNNSCEQCCLNFKAHIDTAYRRLHYYCTAYKDDFLPDVKKENIACTCPEIEFLCANNEYAACTTSVHPHCNGYLVSRKLSMPEKCEEYCRKLICYEESIAYFCGEKAFGFWLSSPKNFPIFDEVTSWNNNANKKESLPIECTFLQTHVLNLLNETSRYDELSNSTCARLFNETFPNSTSTTTIGQTSTTTDEPSSAIKLTFSLDLLSFAGMIALLAVLFSMFENVLYRKQKLGLCFYE
ncbi:hypothetical protein Ddc_13795 [Ditylenchus destructor]|nr:hypothetical protein Ddc_13795 [Ditylenchus destructor]